MKLWELIRKWPLTAAWMIVIVLLLTASLAFDIW